MDEPQTMPLFSIPFHCSILFWEVNTERQLSSGVSSPLLILSRILSLICSLHPHSILTFLKGAHHKSFAMCLYLDPVFTECNCGSHWSTTCLPCARHDGNLCRSPVRVQFKKATSYPRCIALMYDLPRSKSGSRGGFQTLSYSPAWPPSAPLFQFNCRFDDCFCGREWWGPICTVRPTEGFLITSHRARTFCP
jgi:hypothetical protein